MNDGNTLPRLLARNAAQWPHRPAWRHKYLGIWQTQTWSAFARRCNDIARGLAAQGFGRGDRLAVLGDNRPDLYAALLAAQTLGGVGVPLDPEMESARLTAVLEDARVSIAVADTVEQADRLRSLADALPSPCRVFCADTGGFQRHEGWDLASLDTLASAGQARGETRQKTERETETKTESRTPPPPQGEGVSLNSNSHPRPNQHPNPPAAHDLALLLYSAGPLSHPLALSHVQLLTAAEAIAIADPVRPTDEALSYLPMPTYEDAMYSLTLGLLGGFACNCPEAPDSVLRDLREIGPTILFAPPAACIALAQVVAAKADAVTGFKRRCFAFFQDLALRAETLREQRQRIPFGLVIGTRIGELVAYAPVRDQLGLRRARWVHTNAPLPPDTARLLRAIGVALRPAPAHAAEPTAAEQTAAEPTPAQEAAETLHA